MNLTIDEAHDLYFDEREALYDQDAAAQSVIQQGGAGSASPSGGGAMSCGQVCNLCGQVCNLCGQVCNLCGMCGQVCNLCGQVCNLCGCGGCGGGGGAPGGHHHPIRVMLVTEPPVAEARAQTKKATP
jgi:hypothetical protein